MADTRVELDSEDSGLCRAALSPDWAVWGPSGGYVAAIALRAAMARSRFSRPASFHCHFVAVGQFAPVELRVRSVGGGKRAESLAVDVVQDGKTLVAATVWMVDDGLVGYEHDFGRAPDVPGPHSVRSFQELEDGYDEWFPIWRSMEGKPLRWGEGPGEPHSQTWLRFTDSKVSDRESDAIRQLFWLDFPGWNATISAHEWPFRYLAPNLDLTVQFHQFAPDVEWMLADGVVPVARDGIVGCVSRIFSQDGRLLSTGTSKHLCRPNPGYEEDVARARELGQLPKDG